MSTFSQQQRQREIKQCALELNQLSKQGPNRYCADCNHRPAQWTSVTFGSWLCPRCAGIHRGLGVHISFIKSATLDDWNKTLLNKFKLLGGNKAVNEIYEATLRKKDKINHDTNEYKAIDFITQKYVEKKWIKKKQKLRKKRSERKVKGYKQRQKVNKKKSNNNNNNNNNNDVPDLLDFNKKDLSNDTPSTWIKFDENEEKVANINDDRDRDDIPNLLDLNELQNFAFSDLTSINKAQNSGNLLNQDIIMENRPNKIDKATILSMYGNQKENINNNNNNNNYNPLIAFNPSPSPKRNNNNNSPFRVNQNNFNVNYNINNNMNNNMNQRSIVNGVGFNPFDHINSLCANANGYYVYNANVSC